MILPLLVLGRCWSNVMIAWRDLGAEPGAREAEQVEAEVLAGPARLQRDERLDDLPGDRVGYADHSILDHGRVLHQHALDLERPDQVAGRLDHVVGPPDEPQPAVDVAGLQSEPAWQRRDATTASGRSRCPVRRTRRGSVAR
jgi:hypothetical protein